LRKNVHYILRPKSKFWLLKTPTSSLEKTGRRRQEDLHIHASNQWPPIFWDIYMEPTHLPLHLCPIEPDRLPMDILNGWPYLELIPFPKLYFSPISWWTCRKVYRLWGFRVEPIPKRSQI